MNFKRIIALCLVACFCMSALVLTSCNKGPADWEDPNAGNANSDSGSFASADYNGDVFTFAKFTSSTATNEYYCGQWIDAEAITGVATNDAVFKRNQATKDKYKVEIEEKLAGEGAEELQEYYMAGDYSFDVVYGWGLRFGPVVTSNLFYDFRELEAEGYINMEADYWSPAANDDLTIAGRTFLAINDITMSKLSWTGCMFYNPEIIDVYGLEDPQALVESNGWTIDKFLEMVAAVHDDTDGDGSAFTKEDRYGYITFGDENGLIAGCGITSTVKDADGYYTLAIGETKVVDLITKLKETLTDTDHVFTHSDINSGADRTGYDEWEYTRSYFSKGHSLFIGGTPELTREFKDMENGYGVVPLPKYDADQAEYRSNIDACAGIFAIPNTVRNDGVASASFERTGTILEYMAYLSGKDEADSVVNAYYETTIKGQRQTIEKNKDMLEIVKSSGHYDWTNIMQVGGSGKTINDTLTKMYQSRGIASTYKQSESRLKKAIDDTYTAISLLD